MKLSVEVEENTFYVDYTYVSQNRGIYKVGDLLEYIVSFGVGFTPIYIFSNGSFEPVDVKLMDSYKYMNSCKSIFKPVRGKVTINV